MKGKTERERDMNVETERAMRKNKNAEINHFKFKKVTFIQEYKL